eukprot:GEMP01052728.1.p1 GENE.GEMP01052728.1~~GEMP01052728.1.p1  ORF type:complete len:413 (+),score=103.07 GEMP01052728.1:74-1312(+)
MASVHDLLVQRSEGDEIQRDSVAQVCDWTSSVLISIQEVEEGPQDLMPVNDVYFWHSQQEHISRLCSWARSAKVIGVVDTAEKQEADVVKKWNQVVRRLEQAGRETSWNYKYISVVLAALQTLSTGDPALPHFGPFMNSLSYTYGASMYFKDHRMIPLLRKVAKRVEAKALAALPSFDDFTDLPPATFAEKKKHCLNFGEAFQKLASGPCLVCSSENRPQSAHHSWLLAAARTTGKMCMHGAAVCSRYAELLGALERVKRCGIAWRADTAVTHADIFKIEKKADIFAAISRATQAAEAALAAYDAVAPEIEEITELDCWVEEKMGDAEVLRDVTILEPLNVQIPDPFNVPYLPPPDILNGVPMLVVNSEIRLKPFREGRPQTAQPVLQRTRPVRSPDDDDEFEEVEVSWRVH